MLAYNKDPGPYAWNSTQVQSSQADHFPSPVDNDDDDDDDDEDDNDNDGNDDNNINKKKPLKDTF